MEISLNRTLCQPSKRQYLLSLYNKSITHCILTEDEYFILNGMSDENTGILCSFCWITYRQISDSQRDNKVVWEYFQWGVIDDAEDDENVADDRRDD